MKKQIEIITFLVIISIGLAAFFIPAVSADGGGVVYTEASVNPEVINLGETTTVTLRAVTNVTTEKRDVDVVLVTDLSGSMKGDKLIAAQDALKTFVGLAGAEVYIGLASFSNAEQLYSDATWDKWLGQINGNPALPFHPWQACNDESETNPENYHNSAYADNGYSDAHIDMSSAYFIQNKADLNSTINSYAANGGTNIAGGINAAKKMLNESGDSEHLQVIIVMSDGIATMAPVEPGSLDAYMPSDWISDESEIARTAAVKASEIVKNEDITVFAIGFGCDADAEETLMAVASTGNYYFAPTTEDIAGIYSNISEEIEEIAGARAYHVLPENMIYVGNASIEPNIIGGNTLEWIIGDLAPEAPWDVTFEFEVQPQNPGNQPVNAQGSEVTYIYGSEPGNVPFPAVFVDVKTPPVVDFGWDPDTPEADQNVNFTATASDPDGGFIVSYEWNFGDGSTASGETVTHVFDNISDYTVTLTVTDDEGETVSVNNTVTVLPTPPVADFSIAPGEPYYAGQKITFDASASYDPFGSIVSYDWDFGDDDTGSGETVTHAFAKRNYTITLTVTDDEGETDSMNKSVEVKGNIYMPESEEGGPYIGELLNLNVTFDKAVGESVNVTVDGYKIGNVDNVSTNSTIFTWIPMSSGEHTIRAYLYNKSTGKVYDGDQPENYVDRIVYIKKVE